MKIEKGKIVSFHYSLKDDKGALIEESLGSDPTAYLHGQNNILPALEAEMLGKEMGEKLEVSLTPAQGYGEYNADSVQRVPLKRLVGKGGKAKVGQIIAVQTDQGERQVRVVKLGKFNADVDTNHPLAGQQLTFSIEVMDVRDASEEEQSHGHAHGAGGHHH